MGTAGVLLQNSCVINRAGLCLLIIILNNRKQPRNGTNYLALIQCLRRAPVHSAAIPVSTVLTGE